MTEPWDELLDLLAYHLWATVRVLDAAEVLSPEDFARDLRSSHGGVRGTLAHQFASDSIWAARLRGEANPPAAPPSSFADVTALRAPWLAVLAELPEVVSRLAPHGAVRYRNSVGEQESTVAQIVRHLVNHGTYHRGQVVTMLRQLGRVPPNTDLIMFYRERSSGP